MAGLLLSGLAVVAAAGCAGEPEPIIIETPVATGTAVLLEDDDRPAERLEPTATLPVTATATLPATAMATAELININTAEEQVLERLPRIGPAIARRIVAHRLSHGPFRSIDDLLNVPGIGRATLEAIRPLITLGE